MNVRQAVRAGTFYEGSPDACRRHAERLVADAELPDDLPDGIVGGITPHAGWQFSGRLAAMTLKALVEPGQPETFVLFGADHVGVARAGEIYHTGAWQTPLGEVAIDEELAAELLADGDNALRANPDAHGYEHSLEVQVPLIQAIAPAAKILPITAPPTDLAVRIGRIVGEALASRDPAVRVVGSTDLTHHGGHFGNWGGSGIAGVEWTEGNDRRMIELIDSLDAEAVIGEARQNRNACGAGAVAATLAACRKMGAAAGRCLEYTNSYRVIEQLHPGPANDTTVGYASIVLY